MNGTLVDSAQERNKEKKVKVVLESILEIIAQKGPQGLSFTVVSRKSGVSRPWLYKYVGKTKDDLLDFAFREYANKIAPKGKKWVYTKKDIDARLADGFQKLWEMEPQILKIYFQQFSRETDLSRRMMEREKEYSSDMAKALEKVYGVRAPVAELTAEYLTYLRIAIAHFAHAKGISKARAHQAALLACQLIK
ncbi:MAG: hypothetical protein BroJett040_15620 [Oligoflexia bacterium]|nr:MAG: hypothetical protein BroJett040_15620 [Oligoflexia bacterium]